MFDLSKIKPTIESFPPRIILLGEEKVGKTTFASQFPHPILIPIKGEEGADSLNIAKFPTAEKLQDIMDAMESLATQEHTFKTLILDSTSALEPIIQEQVCKEHGVKNIEKVLDGWGKGYVECENIWREITQGMDYLRTEIRMTIILIGHSRIRSFSDPSGETYDRYEMDIHKGVMADLLRWSDCNLFARWKSITKVTDKDSKERKAVRSDRVLCGQSNGSFPAGGRAEYGRLPIEMELNYESFASAVTKAKGE